MAVGIWPRSAGAIPSFYDHCEMTLARRGRRVKPEAKWGQDADRRPWRHARRPQRERLWPAGTIVMCWVHGGATASGWDRRGARESPVEQTRVHHCRDLQESQVERPRPGTDAALSRRASHRVMPCGSHGRNVRRPPGFSRPRRRRRCRHCRKSWRGSGRHVSCATRRPLGEPTRSANLTAAEGTDATRRCRHAAAGQPEGEGRGPPGLSRRASCRVVQRGGHEGNGRGPPGSSCRARAAR